MVRQLAFRGFLLLMAAGWWCPSKAAGAGFILITHGDTIKHLGNVAPQLWAELQKKLPASQIGFKFSYFGIFWLDLWTWGGDYCLYAGNKYWPLTRAEAAQLLNKSESDLAKPWYYTFPPGLLILGGIVIISVLVALFRKRPEDKIKGLFEDPRYQKALEIISEQSKKEAAAQAAYQEAVAAGVEAPPAPPPGDGGFEPAVQHLESEGIPREEAQQNLVVMINALTQVHGEQAT